MARVMTGAWTGRGEFRAAWGGMGLAAYPNYIKMRTRLLFWHFLRVCFKNQEIYFVCFDVF